MTEIDSTPPSSDSNSNPKKSPEDELDSFVESLPPALRPFYPWTEKEEENFRYVGDPTDIVNRLKHKVYSLWFVIGGILTNPEIDAFVKKVPADETSDLYKAKAFLVHLVDIVSKIMTNTDLLEELLPAPAESENEDLKK